MATHGSECLRKSLRMRVPKGYQGDSPARILQAVFEETVVVDARTFLPKFDA